MSDDGDRAVVPCVYNKYKQVGPLKNELYSFFDLVNKLLLSRSSRSIDSDKANREALRGMRGLLRNAY